MDISIVDQKDNPLFGRKEVTFRVAHAGETTPSRVQVRQLVAGEIGTKTENVVIDHMASDYGRGATTGVARAYKSAEEARKVERVHLLKRNSLYVEKAKKGEKKAGA
ncbi:MAG TPA: 30S ribosomal protein S24e [Candidatus Thermoplasmatota archaeon]|nr:30S ribosomal protein S24e [Candidatus Thermoplasmatota archaeon]